MVISEKIYQNCKNLHKIEHFDSAELLEILPKSGVEVSCLKKYEETLLQKSLITKQFAATHGPLWFLGETEINIFLWRNSLSIAHRDCFEFWIDPIKLMEKRLLQLENVESDNPFQQDSFLFGPRDSINKMEIEYLNQLATHLKPSLSHLHALTKVAKIATESKTPVVLLPT